jgi:hypothetical protein
MIPARSWQPWKKWWNPVRLLNKVQGSKVQGLWP